MLARSFEGPVHVAVWCGMSETRQRNNPRLRHEVLVQVTSEHGVFSGWGTNLSLGGVFVNAKGTPSPGTLVDVLLQLPGQPECKLRGRVAWTQEEGPAVEEPGMGVEFIGPDEKTRRILGDMVERLRQDLASGG